MTSASVNNRAEFRDGVIYSLPFILSVIPFGMVIGTVAINNGASPFAAMVQSTLFFAGASQIVTWELYGLDNPIWVIALAIFAVNFRLVLYSAAIGRKLEPLAKPKMASALFLLQDISMAIGLKRSETHSRLTYPFYMGLSLVLYLTWLVATALGIVFGQLIDDPKLIGFDLMVPVYFLILVMGFRSKPNAAIIFAVSVISSALVYIYLGSPYHIGAGGLAGMFIAAALARPQVNDV